MGGCRYVDLGHLCEAGGRTLGGLWGWVGGRRTLGPLGRRGEGRGEKGSLGPPVPPCVPPRSSLRPPVLFQRPPISSWVPRRPVTCRLVFIKHLECVGLCGVVGGLWGVLSDGILVFSESLGNEVQKVFAVLEFTFWGGGETDDEVAR